MRMMIDEGKLRVELSRVLNVSTNKNDVSANYVPAKRFMPSQHYKATQSVHCNISNRWFYNNNKCLYRSNNGPFYDKVPVEKAHHAIISDSFTTNHAGLQYHSTLVSCAEKPAIGSNGKVVRAILFYLKTNQALKGV